ncbi:phosphoglycerate mutase family protein [Vagococcus elongatus]|uniref:Histidine phosphatase family protein n=1 Tax=Vagococcus elongatus TaxID=180344 RepID=A0A430B5B4_9ENTE|nr:histidine phosphatase family protein [Vagococcus elongatus]RSU15503.1 hypothetical protein CBF29_00020 [Vagococcus elongatus]
MKLLGVEPLSLTILTGCGNSTKDSTIESSDTKITETIKTEDVTLYITRHHKIMLNTLNRSQGWIDSPLTPAGIEVAESQGKTLDEFMGKMKEGGIQAVLVDAANGLEKLDKEKVEEGVNWPEEDYDAYISRTTKGIEEIVKDAQPKNAKNVLVVSHGMTIAAFLSHIEPDAEIGKGLKNASVSKVIFNDGKYSVESVNDMSYVEKGLE